MPLDSAPEKEVDKYLTGFGVVVVESDDDISAKTKQLEEGGWENWLLTLFPFAFEEEFSADHRKFWDLRWSVLLRIREQKKYNLLGLPIPEKFLIADREFITLLILGRGLAKSSTIEASAVARGAILDGGYCLYVSEAQDQANEHIGNCKGLITHEESRLAEYYPKMRIVEGALPGGIKTKDREDLFITENGWICRAKGLNSRLRGLRIGNRRPDDIKLDDIDGVNDSIAVSIKKGRQITSSVIPTQARRHTTIDFGQNLIVESGFMTQVHTGKSDAFSERMTVGVSNTFENFREGIEYKTVFDEEDGRIRHIIQPCAVPTWAGVDIAQAQKFLNDSGLETFIAEYQNSFKHLQTEKVFHEFSEARHVIGWDDFERVFGVAYIPAHWKAKATADLGYSKQSYSAWMFTASAAQNSPLPSRYFTFRALTFIQDSIDDQAEKIWEELFPDEAVNRRHFEATQSFADYPDLVRLLKTKPRCKNLLEDYTYNPRKNIYENKRLIAPDTLPKEMPTAISTDEEKALFYVKQAEKTFRSQISIWNVSHEKTGEQKTLAQKYGIPVHKTRHFGDDDGVSEANHLLKGDYTRPHPFFADEEILDENQEPTGLYKLGCPYWFFVVDPLQKKAARDDNGMKTLREQIAGQRWTQEKLGEMGLTKTKPMKFQSDYPDAARMFAADYAMPVSTELTEVEKFRRELPPEAIITPDRVVTVEEQMSIMEQHQIAAEKMAISEGLVDEDEYEIAEDIDW